MNNKINSFLGLLSKRDSSDTVFNQYSDKNILNNLKLYFEYLFAENPKILFIAEAPGYRGCMISGIPFSSGEMIKRSNHDLFKEIKNKIVLREVVSENTATIFWSSIGDKYTPLVWNAFPFHPHKKDSLQSNRKPNKNEIEEGKQYISAIIDLFKPGKICAVGRVAELTLKQMFPDKEISYIRHPSYGGKNDFIKGMKIFTNADK